MQDNIPSEQRQADMVFEDLNAIHVQEWTIRASHLYEFLIAGVTAVEGPRACHHHQLPVYLARILILGNGTRPQDSGAL